MYLADVDNQPKHAPPVNLDEGLASKIHHLYQADPFYSEDNPYEAEFNNGVREITIFVITGIILCSGSYAALTLLRKNHKDEDFIPYSSWEDEFVYKVSFAICTFSLAVSVGAALLLPISTISNEILLRYPSSWFLKWLNSSLIQGIWNLIFVLSNLCLFICLPFAYLFCESEGLPWLGRSRGLFARAKETLVTLILLCVTIIGTMYVLAALIDRDKDSIDRIWNVFGYLPFLYSMVSFIGVLMLLICTPIGIARLFTIVGDLVIKPTFARNLDEEYLEARYEEESLAKKVADYHQQYKEQNEIPLQSYHQILLNNGTDKQTRPRIPLNRITPVINEQGVRLRNGEILSHFKQQLQEASTKARILDRARKTPAWRRILGYPLAMLLLLALTGITLIIVFFNMIQILIGLRSLPKSMSQEGGVFDLGITSLSALGVTGVICETILILYLLVTSLVGLYTLPVFNRIRPGYRITSLTKIILNCGLFVILSSALPLLSKILGITNFDLLGSFGEVKWLGNFYVVLSYNAAFTVAATICVLIKFTARVRNEIVRRFRLFWSTIFHKNKKHKDEAAAPTANSSPSPKDLNPPNCSNGRPATPVQNLKSD